MIDVYSLFLDFESDNNTSQNGFVRPNSDFLRIVNDISIKLWNKRTAKAEKSQEEKDKLFPFMVSKNIAVKSEGGYYGIALKPKDYGRFASARLIVHKDITLPSKDVDKGKCEGFETQEEITDKYYDNIKEVPVVHIDNQRWGAYVEHLTKGPTLEKPGITQVNDYFRIAPRKVSVVVIDYYKEPTPATFVYTLSEGNPQTGQGDQIIYDKAKSVPLQWPEQMRKEFLEELKSWYIQYTRDSNYSNISAQQKQVQP